MVQVQRIVGVANVAVQVGSQDADPPASSWTRCGNPWKAQKPP